MKQIKIILTILLYIFAAIGVFFTLLYIAILLHLTNASSFIDSTNRYLGSGGIASTTPQWASGDEWPILEAAIRKDQAPIMQAAAITGVDPRLIVASLVVEQLRLYDSNRELFKQVFAPLDILGVQSQFSWGVMGIKEDTAIAVEEHLKDPTSPYYLGLGYQNLLDFKTTDPNSERFNRLTDDKNHYYSYLYGALFFKQITTQWKNAGFDISNRPDILSTLYNIGFEHSIPNANPQVGGAEIDIGNTKYSFGGLAYEFYMSDKLTDIFPR